MRPPVQCGDMKPVYRFVGRRPGPEGCTDRLVWQNRDDPSDRIETSEWAFWRLWRYHPMNAAHPQSHGPTDGG